MKGLVIDFETLSENCFDGVAVNCSAYVFDWERFTTNPYTLMEIVNAAKFFKLDITEQKKKYGYKPSKGAMEFWKQQDKKVQFQLVPHSDDIKLETFCKQFNTYVDDKGPVAHWWSRSNIFDPIFLQRFMGDIENEAELSRFKRLLYHSNVRDTRTWIDAKLDFPGDNGFIPVNDKEYWHKTFEYHNSKHDIAADILRLQAISRLENDMEMCDK